MSEQPAGIKSVALHCGVSVGTVSNVLNRPDRVSPATRERVERAMRELGFVRNASASALRAGRSTSLGLVVLDVGNPFFTAVARGVEQAAAERGYTMLLCTSDGSVEREDSYLTFLEEQRVGGVLITPVGPDRARTDLLRSRGTPVVFVDEPGSAGSCSVAADDRSGGFTAGEHLLRLGRRRVVYVTGPPTIRQCVDRGDGLRRAVEAAGLRRSPLVREVMVPALNGASGYAAVAEVLRSPRPDAVLCANDVLALGVLRGLLEAGVRVPDDIALVGYDDIEFAVTAAVPLTSVRQPALEIGRRAAELLLDEVTGEVAGTGHRHEQVLYVPELVVRKSTGG
jgi:LacI family transcriptional regulator